MLFSCDANTTTQTKMISFQTARLDIRPLVVEDAEDVFDMRRDPEASEWCSKQTPDTSISETLDWMLSRPPPDNTNENNTTHSPSKPSPGTKFAIRELRL
ncbi:hypothetical protein BDV29DRAFT_174019 [Aspergillus leporis]|uniref:Uncharacterized protein n=1 Tax=Aspergillus leporis TaxID=41062 RepID=A0A5N5X0Y1_9EURO|nr:hypothetical protein BDV29DRAFT_174019 [Aspergillus leporis]